MTTAILSDLITLTAAALPAAEDLQQRAKDALRVEFLDGDRISGAKVDANQTAAHGLAWLSTYVEALRQMQKWAEALTADDKFGEIEQLIHQIAFGEYLSQIYGGIPMNQGEVVRLSDMGLGLVQPTDKSVTKLMLNGNSLATRSRLVELMRDNHGHATFGASG